LIGEAALAIRMECTAEEIADTIHAHPTMPESIREAAEGVTGFPINWLG
jgi:dihydrolipoamide dehydrogenase